MTHPLATPMVMGQIEDSLRDRKRITRTVSLGLRSLIEATPADRDLSIEIVSVLRTENAGQECIATVHALLEGQPIVAEYVIQAGSEQYANYARLESEPAIPPRKLLVHSPGQSLRDRGLLCADDIVDICDFEYGGGAVRYGSDPIRYIDCCNTTFDHETDLMHINGLVIDMGKARISKIDPDSDAFSYMIDDVPVHFALDLSFPDGGQFAAIKGVDALMERLSSGETTGLEIVVDGVRSIIGHDDIVITRQPLVDDVIDLDPMTLDEPVRMFVEEVRFQMRDEPEEAAFIKGLIDQDAGSVINARLGDAYVFEIDGMDGVMHYGDEPYDFVGMDMHGRLISIREMQDQQALAA